MILLNIRDLFFLNVNNLLIKRTSYDYIIYLSTWIGALPVNEEFDKIIPVSLPIVNKNTNRNLFFYYNLYNKINKKLMILKNKDRFHGILIIILMIGERPHQLRTAVKHFRS